jgi:hypothetical protein
VTGDALTNWTPWAEAGVECTANRQSIDTGARRRRGLPI